MQFLFNDIEVVKLEDGQHLPTALYYRSESDYATGFAALYEASSVRQLNLGFKMKLGQQNASGGSSRTYRTNASGLFVDAKRLTQDFLSSMVGDALERIGAASEAITLVMAEPIAMGGKLIDGDWLKNYRTHIRSIVSDMGFEEVHFLPEPFAVYQYYRYGLSHTKLADAKSYNVLVVDFGGGTLDTCIINTTKSGDIRRGGKNSRPIAAASSPVGGYFINEQIAKRTYFNFFSSDASKRRKFKDYLERYYDIKKNITNLDALNEDLRCFINNFENFTYDVENAKLALSSGITDWSLDAVLDDRVPIEILAAPWDSDSEAIQGWITAADLKSAFVDEVWRNHVRELIKDTLQRAKDDLKGEAVHVVLLSGGTCNLKWLPLLIEEEFKRELDYAEVLTLKDYSEVVAKGLAIECARRFYTDEGTGDFAETTYNSVNLLLDPSYRGKTFKPGKFTPLTEGLEDVSKSPGTLIPPATDLTKRIGKPLRWRVRLSSPPRQRIDYHFLRSSLDYEDTNVWLNVIERFIDTPADIKSFDNNTIIELVIKEGGEAYPSFIYQRGNDFVDEARVTGEPFMLDMTALRAGGANGHSYIGVDFGTSNSSVSYINHETIDIFEARSALPHYADLQQLKENLPYPLSRPLAQYLSAPDVHRRIDRARELFEIAFSLIFAIAYVQYRSSTSKSTKIFKSYEKASIGPSWGRLKDLLPKLSNDPFVSSLVELLSGNAYREIDQIVTLLSSSKHRKEDPESIRPGEAITILYNHLARFFDGKYFGYFRDIRKKPGRRKSYLGTFTVAHGHAPPFIKKLSYEGEVDFSLNDAILADTKTGRCINLTPLVFWKYCHKHSSIDCGHCYTYDKRGRPSKNDDPAKFSFVSISDRCELSFSADSQDVVLEDLGAWLDELAHADQELEVHEGIVLGDEL